MTIVYRTTGAWGAGKGSRLTKAEVDGNTYDLDGRITTLEGSIPAAAIGIDNITAPTDTTLLITLTDSSTQGPFDLPVVDYPFKGTWAPTTSYAVRDTFTINGSFYEVLVDHTSGLTFDAGATDGLGHDLYGLRMSNPAGTIPSGGATDQILYKESGTDFDIGWRSSGVPRAGTTGQRLTKLSGTDFDTTWVDDPDVITTFAGLSDVSLYLPASGDLLEYNGSTWDNVPQSSLSLTFTQLTDVALPAQLPDISDLLGSLSQTQRRDSTVTALSTTGTVSLDPTLGSIFSVTPTGTITLNAASVPAGADIFLVVTTSGTSSFNITFNTNFKSQGVLATGVTSGKKFVIQFVCDGSFFNEVSRTTAM